MTDLVAVRSASRLGAWTAKIARSLAGKLIKQGPAACKYQMVDGFLLQARRVGRRFSASIVDPPGFLYFAGFNDFNTMMGSNNQVAVCTGSRDDFDYANKDFNFGVKYKARFGPLNKPAMMLLPFSGPPDSGYANSTITLAPTVQDRAFLSAAYFRASLLAAVGASSFDPLDSTSHFTLATPAAVGGGALVPFVCGVGVSFDDAGIPSFGTISRNYLAQQGFWVQESDLPDGWKLHPRRQVSYTQYSPANDPYRVRIGPGMIQPGFCHDVAQSFGAIEIDRYCIAARTFRQHVGTWFKAEPGAAYRPPYYDRYGKQGMVVAVGEYDRATYDPAYPPARAAIASLQVVEPTDLPITDLHPLPSVLPVLGTYDKPDLPNFGEFIIPHVARAAGGFAVFSVYRTLRDENDRTAVSPDEELIGPAYSLVTTIAGGSSYALLADWDYGDGGSPIETSSAGKFYQPWIVGACSWSRKVLGVDQISAFCLVWEHEYVRRAASSGLDSRGSGGRFSLYRTDGAAPTRLEISVAGAPLFAPSMDKAPGDPFVINNNRGNFPGKTAGPGMLEPFSEAQYLGEGRAVTAAIDTPYPAASGDRITQASHPIRSLVIDLATGAAVLGGTITSRVRGYTKCLISVVQQLQQPTADSPGHAAVLLASVVDHVNLNAGSGGKVFISFDTGASWQEYVTDTAGQAGVFYIGNKLWLSDSSKPLTKGGML